MDTEYITSELQKNKYVFRELLQNLDNKLIAWKQTPEKWCLLEIICHLYDEEREDFRARLKSALENHELEFNPVDPGEWVTSRKYMEQDFDSKLNSFLEERDNSINFLQQLKEPKWDNFYKHPKFGNLSAKMFFASWLAHDYLHIRQIVKLKFDYLKTTTGEKLNYAGEW